MLKKRLLLLLSIVFILTLMTACGNKASSEASSEEKKNEERTLEHAMGQMVLPENPERILAPYLEDSLLALGVKPVAQWSIGETVLDYLQPQLEGIPKIAWDLPLEQTLKQDPGLIIFSSPSSLQNGKYEKYKKIAPTYVFEDAVSSDWRAQLKQMGEILNKQDQARQALNEFDQKAKEAKASLQESIGNESVALIWTKGEQFFVFEKSRYAAEIMYEDLGVTQPEFIKNLPKAEVQWNPMSLEKLGQLDADHIFVLGQEGEQGFEILEKSSVWQSLNAVKKEQVYKIHEPSHWTIDGVIAHSMTMDKIKETLAK